MSELILDIQGLTKEFILPNVISFLLLPKKAKQ